MRLDQRFRKSERLLKKEEIRSVLRQRGFEGKYCYLHIRPNQGSNSRLAVVVSRAAGKAVVRNKAKRRLREIFRRNKNYLNQTLDLVIRAKRSIGVASYRELGEDFNRILKRKRCLITTDPGNTDN